MSAVLTLALLLQVIEIALLRNRLGKAWLRHPGALLVVTSAIYIGMSPMLLSFPSVRYWDIYQRGVQQTYIDQATLIMAMGMLAFTLCYLASRPELGNADSGDLALIAQVLDWRVLAVACAPLAVLTYEGRGYGDTLTTGAGAPLSSALAGTFFVLLVALTAFALILRHGPRWFLPTLIAQSVLLAAAGERTPVAADAIILIILMRHVSIRPSRGQARAAAALTVLVVLAITGARAQQGRTIYYSSSGLAARVSAVAGGLADLGARGGPGIAAQAAIRLDGVDFAGAVLQAKHLGAPPLPVADVPGSLLITVPSVVWQAKQVPNPALLEIGDLGLQDVNFLPGLAGLYAGFLPSWALIAFLAGLGLLTGRWERWLLRERSPARLVLLAGAVTAALTYEQGLPGMLVAVRTGVALGLATWAAERLLASQRQRTRRYRIQRVRRPSEDQPPHALAPVLQSGFVI